jgi:5'-3' exonuclease|tara:strand:- start:1250 stop:2305 length:1056 start_codon:yes stop_codon:yes gene_type:complete
MKQEYFSMLENLQEGQASKAGPNDKVLIIDGLNTFIRSFAVSPVTNDDGIHVGGITGFLMSVGYAIKMLQPTRVIICFDGKGGSQRRRKLFPDYKANRMVRTKLNRTNAFGDKNSEDQNMKMQLGRLVQYLDHLPVQILAPENIEADDAIAYISKQLLTESKIFIMSSDKDFIQLVDDRIAVWSPTKKKLYFKDDVLVDYKVPAHNYLLYRTLTGDKSDNIPGVRGAGLKTLQKRIPLLFEDTAIGLDDLLNFILENNDGTKVLADILGSKDVLELNHKLMQLEEVDISGSSKSKIMNVVYNPMNRMNTSLFKVMMIQDGITGAFRNLEFWMNERFLRLDTHADTFNKSCK